MSQEKCPCCQNHCDVSNLSCRKGVEYFGMNSDKVSNEQRYHLGIDETSMTLDERAIYKIRKCGHFLHHSDKIINLDFLSEEEKNNLIIILSKCLDNWN